jgi:hypothetical protein
MHGADTGFVNQVKRPIIILLNILRVLVENHVPTAFLPVRASGYARHTPSVCPAAIVFVDGEALGPVG